MAVGRMKLILILFLLINLSWGQQSPQVSVQAYPTATPEMGDEIQVEIIIKSPINVSYAELQINYPSNLNYGTISLGGFLKGASVHIEDQNLVLQNIPDNDSQSKGNLSIPLKSNERTSVDINIEKINLKGDHSQTIPFKTLPTINIQWQEPIFYESGIEFPESYASEKEMSAMKIVDKTEIFKGQTIKIVFLIWNTLSEDIIVTNINDLFPINELNFYQKKNYSIKLPIKVSAYKIGKIPYQEISSQIEGKATILPSIIKYKIDGKDGEKELLSYPEITEVDVKNRPPRIDLFDINNKNLASNEVQFLVKAIDEDGIIEEIEIISSKDPRLYFDRPNHNLIDLNFSKYLNNSGERIIILRMKDNDDAWIEKEITLSIPEPRILKLSRFIIGGSITIFFTSLLLVFIQIIVGWPKIILRFRNLYAWFSAKKFYVRLIMFIFIILFIIIVYSALISILLKLSEFW